MGWGASTEVVNTSTDTSANSNANAYGTRTPNLSTDYTNSIKNFNDQLNPSGANATQQSGINLLSSVADPSTRNAALDRNNTDLTGIAANYAPFTTQTAPQATTTTSAGAPTIAAKTGADYMNLYQNPYQSQVVDASLADYDAGVNQQYGTFKAGTAGAFGNKRTGVADANFADAAARGRGTLASNLLSTGFTTAAGLGEQDANRTLSADTSNAGNLLSNNQFNANAANSASQFNANADIQNRQQQMAALSAQTGITQDQLSNVLTSDGINMEAAQSLLAAGSITQEQLDSLVQMYGAGNGSSYTDNSTSASTGSSDTTKLDGKVSFGT